ncbi:MAG: hypothetical protein EBU90_03915 [Proteobacteria bacterium]|nr:hypothetical protein [Pseudomonadota bacterium]NBP14216.1 hypothetical protein [bacterium]
MKIAEMAEAHLQTVAKAIVDLQNQKNILEQEIKKLSDYLQAGKEELAKTNDPNVKHYLGE